MRFAFRGVALRVPPPFKPRPPASEFEAEFQSRRSRRRQGNIPSSTNDLLFFLLSLPFLLFPLLYLPHPRPKTLNRIVWPVLVHPQPPLKSSHGDPPVGCMFLEPLTQAHQLDEVWSFPAKREDFLTLRDFGVRRLLLGSSEIPVFGNASYPL